MSELRELLGLSSDQVIGFFQEYLKDEVNTRKVSDAEVRYVAGILAHFAHTSRCGNSSLPMPISLFEILDNFVLPELQTEVFGRIQDPEILEIAGSQTLLLAGFFRDQMKRRHNVGLYDQFGSSFYLRASENTRQKEAKDLLRRVSSNFSDLALSCRNLNRTLWEQKHLLRISS